jgi:type III secretion protein V
MGQKEKEKGTDSADGLRVCTTLKHYISYKYSKNENILAVFLLDPTVEDIVRKAIRQTSARSRPKKIKETCR